MAVIVLRLDDFKSIVDNRPKQCPFCGCNVLQRWGIGSKPIQDAQLEVGVYHRYRCNSCQRTFRYYTPGVDRGRLTQRIRRIAGIAWVLGMSAREVVEVLGESGIQLTYTTVWQEGNDLIKQLKDRFGLNSPGRSSIDKQFLKIKTRGIGTSVMVDLGEGKVAVLGRMDEVDFRKVIAWLEPLITGLGIQISLMGTDKLFEMDQD